MRSASATVSYSAHAQDKGTVGIAMPTKSSLRWISDGNELKAALEAKGYTVDLQYAEDDIPNQLAQIENMVTKDVKALVIAAIDGTTLSAVLQQAADKGIKVIAYDRLIRDSGNVDYYTTFDNFKVGVLQAEFAGRGPEGALPGREAVERRAVRRFAGRQQRLLLLRRRDVGAAADDRQRRHRRQVRPDGHGKGRHAALGRRGGAGPHGQHPVGQLFGRQPRPWRAGSL